jgi:hypothetical protein
MRKTIAERTNLPAPSNSQDEGDEGNLCQRSFLQRQPSPWNHRAAGPLAENRKGHPENPQLQGPETG